MLPPGLQNPQAPQPITLSKLLVVEGRTPFEFFKALLREIALLDQIEIRNMGGNDDLGDFLALIKITTGFAGVTSLGLVRDAEQDAARAFAAVQNSLRQAGLSAPEKPNTLAPGQPSVSVFILPDCAAPGMLESLCWQSVSNDAAIQCVQDYLRCLQERGLAPSNLPRAQAHAFLASRPRPDLLVGQAAHAGYWPWNHPAFEPVKQFLRAL